MKVNVFIPHRWNNNDFADISAILDRTKFSIRDYSVPSSSPFDSIDRRFNVDPQIQKQIKYASVVICSNRSANNSGMALDEIKFAISIGKPVVAVKITESTSSSISSLGVPVVAKRKDSLEAWISQNI
ncbi:hypothetical protein Desde_1391 [Desulfitobacterium dehalogenans ATCC 51507]|uniref:Thoeris protein ThsB TIR-like domain-containing protein n=1 Tax=Desulfitobacterium dehalogenans (strain ATCC 51507 / DSM 9161 / JW/IU-DC1) TaxID=756499 RepID=I4A780_DESDJ|nr:hypothetical protein [Desulfitobacterium dehalogenans]AFL99814.1 hypothetical protein Desde_1391 [Desulfitobacterium dehalogenans ATCC 51507]